LPVDSQSLTVCARRLQWQGLPYGEATFEKPEDIEKAGGAPLIAELHVWILDVPCFVACHRCAMLGPKLSPCVVMATGLEPVEVVGSSSWDRVQNVASSSFAPFAARRNLDTCCAASPRPVGVQAGSRYERATNFRNVIRDGAQEREKRCVEPGTNVDIQRRIFRASGTRAMERQPDYLKGGGRLRDYQLDGLNWMIYSWSQDNNCILADEVRTSSCCADRTRVRVRVQVGGTIWGLVRPGAGRERPSSQRACMCD
jgi:hypothetical protein